MSQATVFNQHTQEYEEWYERYSEVYESELLAIREQMGKLPENIHGIEVGLGTGRFAAPLGIKEGIEPAENMAAVARRRGIEIMEGTAEHLPYKALHFDFVLFVTICHFDNLSRAFKEAHRVLKRDGSILVAFIREDGPIGQSYQEKRHKSTFYEHAKFYSAEKVTELLKEAGFKDFDYVQTLFGGLDEVDEVQSPEPGFDRGSFVVVKATKNR